MKRQIKALSLLLALTLLSACGTPVKAPTADAFIQAVEDRGKEVIEQTDNTLAVLGTDWCASYKEYHNKKAARSYFRSAVATASIAKINTHDGRYETAVQKDAGNFLFYARAETVCIFAQGTPECEQTIRDLMASLGFEET